MTSFRNYSPRAQKSGGGKKRRSFPWKFSGKNALPTAAAVLAGLFLAGTVSAIGLIAWVSKDLPDPNRLSNREIAQTTKIYDRTGEVVLYELHGAEKRTSVELDHIAPDMINATIATEDR